MYHSYVSLPEGIFQFRYFLFQSSSMKIKQGNKTKQKPPSLVGGSEHV